MIRIRMLRPVDELLNEFLPVRDRDNYKNLKNYKNFAGSADSAEVCYYIDSL